MACATCALIQKYVAGQKCATCKAAGFPQRTTDLFPEHQAKSGKSTHIQTIILDHEKFTASEARDWLRAHKFQTELDEAGPSIRARQVDPGKFEEGSFRTIELKPGVKAVVGHLKDPGKSGADQTEESPPPPSDETAKLMAPVFAVMKPVLKKSPCTLEQEAARVVEKGWREKPRFKPLDGHNSRDEGFDTITLSVVPRFKTSGLSGDVWRKSVSVSLARKGAVVFSRAYNDFADATNHMPWLLRTMLEQEPTEEKGFTKKGIEYVNTGLRHSTPDLCAQPGCLKPKTTTYRLKKEYCEHGEAHEPLYMDVRRGFCKRHADRGNADLEDCNSNYETVDGHGPEGAAMAPDDESPSVFGGVIPLV